MSNLVNPTGALSNSSTSSTASLVTRLDALLLVLKTCIGTPCKVPWASIFPNGEVQSLGDALNTAYDAYFDGLPRVSYGMPVFPKLIPSI